MPKISTSFVINSTIRGLSVVVLSCRRGYRRDDRCRFVWVGDWSRDSLLSYPLTDADITQLSAYGFRSENGFIFNSDNLPIPPQFDEYFNALLLVA